PGVRIRQGGREGPIRAIYEGEFVEPVLWGLDGQSLPTARVPGAGVEVAARLQLVHVENEIRVICIHFKGRKLIQKMRAIVWQEHVKSGDYRVGTGIVPIRLPVQVKAERLSTTGSAHLENQILLEMPSAIQEGNANVKIE